MRSGWTPRWLAVLLAAAGVGPGVAEAQRGGMPPDVRDSLVLRLAAYRVPCPDPPPPAWTLTDSTLGRPPLCHLVEAAARLVRDQIAARRVPRSESADPWRPLCVRLVEMQNTGSSGQPGDWMVVFDLSPTLIAEVLVDRRSGGPVFAVLGDGSRRLGPPCLIRSSP